MIPHFKQTNRRLRQSEIATRVFAMALRPLSGTRSEPLPQSTRRPLGANFIDAMRHWQLMAAKASYRLSSANAERQLSDIPFEIEGLDIGHDARMRDHLESAFEPE